MTRSATNQDLVVLRNAKKHFAVKKGLLGQEVGKVKAVDGIDLTIHRGEALGLVGESGCGKSTLGRLILRLEEPTAGQIIYDGQDILQLSAHDMLSLRRRMQIIFQDPYSSLNPRQTIGRIIGEGLAIHKVGNATERRDRVAYLMEVVGLRPEQINRYPHEFSGGQRQRIGIARALALQPEFIICDEPLSALDVSIQAQIINLLQDLQEEYQLTYLFISHDLSVVRHLSDRVAVMYLGRLVELADKDIVYENPYHPYTRSLLRAIPIPDPDLPQQERQVLPEPPETSAASEGCLFSSRCPHSQPHCQEQIPPWREYQPGHWVRCFLQESPSTSASA